MPERHWGCAQCVAADPAKWMATEARGTVERSFRELLSIPYVSLPNMRRVGSEPSIDSRSMLAASALFIQKPDRQRDSSSAEPRQFAPAREAPTSSKFEEGDAAQASFWISQQRWWMDQIRCMLGSAEHPSAAIRSST